MYDVILVDIPWKYRVWSEATGQGRSAESHYKTMTIEEVCSLGDKVKSYANKNCVLFLWTTWPTIFDYVPRVFDAWGFKYKTLGFEWWKLNKRWYNYYTPLMMPTYTQLERIFAFGMGYYTRANSEPCLIATKGNMPVAVRNERNFIISPIREHSRKPDEQYQKIENLYPDMKYLELFARYERKGWDSIGFELDGEDIRV